MTQNNLEQELQQLLTDFRYISSMGLGERRLQDHHIDALTKCLVPFIEKKINKAINDMAWK